MKNVFYLGIVLILSTACGGSSSDGALGEENPSGEMRSWTGTWLSRTGVGGTEVFELTESGGSVSGSVSFTNSPCFQSGTINGTLAGGTLVGTVTAGGIEVSMTGTMTGNLLSGTYDSISAGACTGDTGTFSASR